MANVIEVVIRAKDDAKGTIDRVTAALKGLEASGGPLSSTFGRIGGAIGAIGPTGLIAAGAIGALGAATAVAANSFVGAVKEGANFGDELNKVGVQTGLTVEEVSRLKFAADQNESSLGALSSSIKFMSKNLFEAQQGGKEQIDTLHALGFTGEEAAGHLGSTSEALFKVSDRLHAIPDQGTRTALAMRLLGRGAIEALPLLQQGSAAIRSYGEEADRTGITVSSAAGKLGDDFNDAVGKVNAQVGGLKTKLAEAALPAMIAFEGEITKAITALSKFITENQAAIASLANLAGKVFTVTLNFVVKGAEAAVKAFEFFQKFYDPLGASLSRASAAIAAQDQRLSELSHTLFGDVKTGFDTAVKGADDTAGATKKASDEMAKYELALQRAYLVSQALAESLKNALGVKATAAAIPSIQKAVEDASPRGIIGTGKKQEVQKAQDLSADQFADGLSRAADQVARLEPLDEITPTLDAAGESALKLSDYFESAGINVERLLDQLAAVGGQLGDLNSLTIALADSVTDAFSAAFDPLQVGISGIADAVGNLRSAFDGAFSSAINKILAGQASMLKFTDAIKGAIQAVARLVLEIGAAIVKAIILKALGFGFLSAGGTVKGVDSGTSGGGNFASHGGTQPYPRFSQGGSLAHFVRGGAVAGVIGLAAGGSLALPRLASGGAIAPIVRLAAGGSISSTTFGGHMTSSSFTSVVHAVDGMRVVPGFPQSYDSVPALLAPGEVVLPNVGGKSPSDLLGNLSNMSRDLSALMARQTPVYAQGGRQAPAIGELHVHAFDADSVRNHVRGGGLDRELARREELGRGL